MKKPPKFEDLKFNKHKFTACSWVSPCPMGWDFDDSLCVSCGAKNTGEITFDEAQEWWMNRLKQEGENEKA